MSSIAGLFQNSPNGGKIPQSPQRRTKDWRDEQEFRTRINKRRIEAFFRIEAFLNSSPKGQFLLLTLTRKAPFDQDIEIYQRDWRRWYNASLKKKIGKSYIRVMELQRSGRIHFHLLVDTGIDVKSHYDHDKNKFKPLTSDVERKAVQKLIKDIRKSTLNKHGFGRIHIEPIVFTTSRTAAYLVKSLGKKIYHKNKPIPPKRITFTKDIPKFKGGNFDLVNTYFRKGLVEWAKLEGFEEDDFEAIELAYGKGWRWICMHAIMDLGFKSLKSNQVTALHSIGH